MRVKSTLLKAANNEWVVIVLFLVSVWDAFRWIFGLLTHPDLTMPPVDWIDVLVKAALCGIIILLQRTIRDVRREGEVRRIIDGCIQQYRARQLYQGNINFGLPSLADEHLTRALQEEVDAIRPMVHNALSNLPQVQVDKLLGDYYQIFEQQPAD